MGRLLPASAPDCDRLQVGRGYRDCVAGESVVTLREFDEVALRRCAERYERDGAYEFYTGGPVPRY